MTKVKEVFSYTDTTGERLVCRAKLVFAPGDNKQSTLPNYELPFVISEMEEIVKGDWFLLKGFPRLFDGLERQNGHLGCYVKNYGFVYEHSIRNKILAFPENFSPELLQRIIDGELYNDQDVYIECDQNTFDGQVIRKFSRDTVQLYVMNKDAYNPKKPLPALLVKKIIAEVKRKHEAKGVKMRADKMGYEPTTKSYKVEELYGDLEFILNHLHL